MNYSPPAKFSLKLSAGCRRSHHQNIISRLHGCSNMGEMKQIHAQMIRTRLAEDTFLASRVISFLADDAGAGSIRYARCVFDTVSYPSMFIWNSMIRGYVHSDLHDQALRIFHQMTQRCVFPDGHTYPIVLSACARLHDLVTGRTIHGMTIKHGFEADMYAMSGFVNCYSAGGEVELARKIFDQMHERDVVAWTSMMSGYAQSGRCEEAFSLFTEMRQAGQEPNKVTIISLVMACCQSSQLDKGIWLHNYILDNKMEKDIVIGNALISMYAKWGNMTRASGVFDRILVKNVVTWNAMIGGFVKNELYTEAMSTFYKMTHSRCRPNEITFVSSLSACAQLNDLNQGVHLHKLIEEYQITVDVFVGNALISMYGKCGELERAASVFQAMPVRDVVSWTSLLSGYVQGSCFKEAVGLFEEMLSSGVEPNEFTLVSVLSACAQLGALDQGRQIHYYIKDNRVKKNVHLGNALVDMYCKCGCIEMGLCVFSEMASRDASTWNAMIGGLASHGRGREATVFFNDMLKAGEVKPDHVTFLAVLSACAHSGLVEEGYHYFNSMLALHNITPKLEHYGCVVDLLTRAGELNEACEFITRMPMEPNSVIWGSLLAACRLHRQIELAEKAVQNIKRLAPGDEGFHVLLSNMYAEAGRWDEMGIVRAQMDEEGIRKSAGSSTLEVDAIQFKRSAVEIFH